MPQYGFDYWPRNAKIIQVDINARKLGLTNHVDVPILGDAKLTAESLTQIFQETPPSCVGTAAQRLAEPERERAEWEAELDSLSVTPGTQAEMEPREALRELEKAMPENAMVSTDIGNICSVSNSYLRFKKPKSFFAAMAFGNCGYAFPAAMGAKIGAPERPAVAYVGDGAWGMSLNEMLTCVRENIPVVAVVFNNGQWGAEKKNQVDFYSDRFVGTNLTNPSFAEISKTMGAEGLRVTRAEEVGPALKQLLATNKPGVLEIAVSRTLADPFRRDALSKPVRHLEKYKDFV